MTENISAVVDVKIPKRKKPSFSEEQRRKHCKDYQESGLNMKEYCELNKISQSALRKWVKQYPSKPFFAPVSTPIQPINPSSKQTLEVIFPSGLRLRFPELIDLSVIEQLIREVGSCN